MIPVKSPEDVSHQGILLAHGVPQLLQNCFEVELTQQGIGIFEDLSGIFVHVQNQKLMVVHLHHFAWQQIVGLKEAPGDLVQVDALLQEAARHDAHIPLWRLMNGQGVILQVEGNDKHAVCFFRLRLGKLRLEAQDFALVLEEFYQVLLGQLGHQMRHRAHGIFPGAVARVGRRFGPGYSSLRQANIHHGFKLHAQLLPEVVPGELIRIIDEEVVVPEQLHSGVHPQIMTMHKLALFARLCLRSLHLVGPQGQLPSPEEDGELLPATIQGILFRDLQGVVGQEEHDGKGPAFELGGCDVIHHRIEAKNLFVVLQELLHVCIDVSTTQHHLSVDLLIGSGLG
mmetsp:Transcript_61053/g.96670  ORF Transcript_61053/g.96670 Transcript_61053/m.96670 type:complete len:341 (-) Transcript_61053:735-1757(-)